MALRNVGEIELVCFNFHDNKIIYFSVLDLCHLYLIIVLILQKRLQYFSLYNAIHKIIYMFFYL